MRVAHILRRGVLALLLTAPLVACGEKGSGTISAEARPVAEFTEVSVSGVIELQLSMGATYSLELSGDDNLLPLVETTIDGANLIIRTTENVNPTEPLVAKVTAVDVTHVRGSGVANLNVNGVDNKAFAISISGAGQAKASGTTESLTVRVSGAGKVDTQAVAAERVDVKVSGAGTVDVSSPDELKAEISGAGKVRYSGDPKVSSDISGAGSVTMR